MAKTICLEDLLEDYLVSGRASGYSDKTIKNSKDKITKFIWWLNTTHPTLINVQDLTTALIREYISFLRTPKHERWGKPSNKSDSLTAYSVWSYCSPIKALLNWAEAEEYIEQTPFNDRVKVLSKKDDKRKVKTMTDKDIVTLFNHLGQPEQRNTYLGARNLALCAVLLDTGVRLGELLSMQITSVDLRGLTISVSGKTGLRVVPISPLCKEFVTTYLRKYREGQETDSNKLWLTTDGYPLGSNSLQSLFVRLAESLNITISPHRFRHTFVSKLANSGVNSFVVQALAGHAKIETTQGYYTQDKDALAASQATNSPLMMLSHTEGANIKKRGRGRPKQH